MKTSEQFTDWVKRIFEGGKPDRDKPVLYVSLKFLERAYKEKGREGFVDFVTRLSIETDKKGAEFINKILKEER